MVRISTIVCLGLLMLVGNGCASIGKMPKMPWEPEEPEYFIPTKMVVTWKDAVRYNPNDLPTRGFGGRIHFYDDKNKPIRVKGRLVVYGYNDSSDGLDRERPDRKYVFDQEKIESHYSLSKLGHSYSFWIPWDAAGGEQHEITLAPFFTPENGQVIMSEQSKNVLPGIVRDKSNEEASPSDSLVSRVTYQRETIEPQVQPVQAGQQNLPRMKTTTIQLPDTFRDRLKGYDSAAGATRPVPQAGATYQPIRRPSRSERQEVQLPMPKTVNLQNYRPSFAKANEFSEYLSQAPSTRGYSVTPGLPSSFQPEKSQAPAAQNALPVSKTLASPQSPSTWPPGLPRTPQHVAY